MSSTNEASPRDLTATVHPTACIEDGAILGSGVSVGASCFDRTSR